MIATDQPIPVLKPRLLTIRAASAYSGMSHAGLYRALSDGTLRAVKLGNRTMIPTEVLDAFIDSLPAATFRPTRSAV